MFADDEVIMAKSERDLQEVQDIYYAKLQEVTIIKF